MKAGSESGWSAIKLEKRPTMSKDRSLSILLGVRAAGVVLIALLLSVSAGGTRQANPNSAADTNPKVNSPVNSGKVEGPSLLTNAVSLRQVNETYGKLPLHFQANRGQ